MSGEGLTWAVGLGLLLASASFVPLGLYLQWAVPGDGPYEYGVTAVSLILPLLALCVRHHSSLASWMKRLVITVALSVFCLVQVWLYVPQLSRRIGPWEDLRGLLLAKADEVQSFREERGIAPDRVLSREEVALVQSSVFAPAPTFTFPFPRRQVRVRLMKAEPPYVGVDYGNGRNCVFDLNTMWATYCD